MNGYAGTFAAFAILWHAYIPVPWWVLVIFTVFVGHVACTFGMALEKVRGVSVEVGSLKLDTGVNNVFYVVIKNGPVPANIRVLINSVADSRWPMHIEHPYEAHWRGGPTQFCGDFVEQAKAQAGLLGVGKHIGGNPSLFIWPKEGDGPIISRDMPLEQQGVITIEVVVTCETKMGERGRPVERVFRIIPDPGSSIGYKVAERSGVVSERKSFWRKAYRRFLYLTKDRRRRTRQRSG